MNDIIQISGVILALALCAIWIVRQVRLSRKNKREGWSNCNGCQLKEHCKSKQECLK